MSTASGLPVDFSYWTFSHTGAKDPGESTEQEFVTGDQPSPQLVGSFVAVDVLAGGYRIIPNATPYKKWDDCQKACNISNAYKGFSKSEVDRIIDISMGAVKAPDVGKNR